MGSPLKGFQQEGKQTRGFGKEEGLERAEPEERGQLGSLCGTQMRDGVACVGWGPGDGFREIWVENQMNSGIYGCEERKVVKADCCVSGQGA